jgi:membrane-bound lytic murein transglycosylase B
MHWNRSENYALAVGILADYVKSGKKWQKLEQNDVQKVKTDDVLKIQSFINKLGWFKLDEDGQLGSKTRDAIKKVQKKAMLPQDGYPDYQLMRKIDNYNNKKGFSIPVPERKLHKAK